MKPTTPLPVSSLTRLPLRAACFAAVIAVAPVRAQDTRSDAAAARYAERSPAGGSAATRPGAPDITVQLPADLAAPSGTAWAKRVVRFPVDPLSPDIDEFSRMLDAIARKLAQPMLDVPASRVNEILDYTMEFGDEEFQLTLEARVPATDGAQVRRAMREFADKLVSELQRNLESYRAAVARTQLEPRQQREADARASLDAVQRELRDAQARVRQKSGRAELSPDRYDDAMSRLDEERMQVEVEQAAKTARREALVQSLADATKSVEQRVASDLVVAELQKAVQLRTERLELMKKGAEAGQISAAEVSEAGEALAEARARLLEHQRELALQSGGDVVAQWNRELMSLAVDERELSARLNMLTERLERLRAVSDQMDELRRMRDQLDQQREQLEAARHELREASEELRAIERHGRLRVRESENSREVPTTATDEPPEKE